MLLKFKISSDSMKNSLYLWENKDDVCLSLKKKDDICQKIVFIVQLIAPNTNLKSSGLHVTFGTQP